MSSRSSRLLSATVAVLALVALVIEFVLELGLAASAREAAGAAVRYFSYFTILSNIAVALACGLPLLGRPARLAAFFAQPRVRGAVALYIAVTSAVFITMLAKLWNPTGAWWFANGLLHYWVPGLYLALWLWEARATRARLVWSDALRWLVFPAGYLFWILVRGALVREYPYPFVNVVELGMGQVLLNSLVLTVLFLLLGTLFVALARWVTRPS